MALHRGAARGARRAGALLTQGLAIDLGLSRQGPAGPGRHDPAWPGRHGPASVGEPGRATGKYANNINRIGLPENFFPPCVRVCLVVRVTGDGDMAVAMMVALTMMRFNVTTSIVMMMMMMLMLMGCSRR